MARVSTDTETIPRAKVQPESRIVTPSNTNSLNLGSNL